MRIIDQLRSVRHTFGNARGRVALTLLGVMIATASIVLLASLLRSGEDALLAMDQDANDADVIRVDKAAPPPKDEARSPRLLSQRDAAVLADSPALAGAQVTTEKIRWTKAVRGRKSKRVALDAAEPVALSLYRLALGRGRFLSDGDLREERRVCVVGINVWRELLDSAPLDGLTIRVDDTDWAVVGVLENKPAQGGGDGPWMWNNKVIVPRTTFNAIFYQDGQLSRIYVRLGDEARRRGRALAVQVASARHIVRGILMRRHFGVENFKIDQNASDLEQMKMIMLIVDILLLSTALLSLFVGGINIMNIMLVTVTERTREIGIRRAVGADQRSLLTQFMLEAALIALVGGVIGVVGGISMAYGVALILRAVMGDWSFAVVPWSIAAGLALSIVTGVVFGLFPAWRASRLDPVEALRGA